MSSAAFSFRFRTSPADPLPAKICLFCRAHAATEACETCGATWCSASCRQICHAAGHGVLCKAGLSRVAVSGSVDPESVQAFSHACLVRSTPPLGNFEQAVRSVCALGVPSYGCAGALFRNGSAAGFINLQPEVTALFLTVRPRSAEEMLDALHVAALRGFALAVRCIGSTLQSVLAGKSSSAHEVEVTVFFVYQASLHVFCSIARSAPVAGTRAFNIDFTRPQTTESGRFEVQWSGGECRPLRELVQGRAACAAGSLAAFRSGAPNAFQASSWREKLERLLGGSEGGKTLVRIPVRDRVDEQALELVARKSVVALLQQIRAATDAEKLSRMRSRLMEMMMNTTTAVVPAMRQMQGVDYFLYAFEEKDSVQRSQRHARMGVDVRPICVSRMTAEGDPLSESMLRWAEVAQKAKKERDGYLLVIVMAHEFEEVMSSISMFAPRSCAPSPSNSVQISDEKHLMRILKNKVDICNFCQSHSHEKMMVCARCTVAKYCSRKCQKADWKSGHKAVCVSCSPEGQARPSR